MFEWINYSDHQNAVISFIRKGKSKGWCICGLQFYSGNCENYRIFQEGKLKEILIVMQKIYGGSAEILLN
jgi:1,4-alpha-glucan branching enzyme